jgi:hypothetical protein
VSSTLAGRARQRRESARSSSVPNSPTTSSSLQAAPIRLLNMRLGDLIYHLKTLVPIAKAVPILGSRVEGSLEAAIKIAEATEVIVGSTSREDPHVTIFAFRRPKRTKKIWKRWHVKWASGLQIYTRVYLTLVMEGSTCRRLKGMSKMLRSA